MFPILFHLGHLALPSFGVLAAFGLMAALALSLRTAPLVNLNPDALWDAGLFMVLAAFILSRLLLIAANLRTFLSFPVLLLAVPSLTATGLLLTAFATLAWLSLKRLPILRVLDAWAPCATLTWACLALGHFATGSDPGIITDSPFGLRFPGETVRLHPVALYAALLGLALTAALLLLLTRIRDTRPGTLAAAALAALGLSQFLLTFLRQPVPDSALPLGLDPIEWQALFLVLAGAAMLLLLPPLRRPAEQTKVE